MATAVAAVLKDRRRDTEQGFDLRLMSSLNDVSGIPTEGKNLIIVAAVNNVLHFRIFDGDGKVVVDTDEKRLTEQARQIEDLRKQLESLWPPHELTRSEKGRVITAVTSIVGHTPEQNRDKGSLLGDDPVVILWLLGFLLMIVSIFGMLSSLQCSRSICMAYEHNDNIEKWFRGNTV